MALKGVMIPNSYAVVDNVNYSKQKKRLLFDLVVYTDSSKKQVLTTLPYQLDGSLKLKAVIDSVVDDYPEDPQDKKYILDIGDYFEIRSELDRIAPRTNISIAVRDVDGVEEFYNSDTGEAISAEEVESINADKELFFTLKLHRNKHIIEKVNGEWKDTPPVHAMVVEDAEGNRLMFDGDSGEWQEAPSDLMLDTDFDETFGIVAQDDKNLLAIIYDWLKKRPEMTGTTDA